MSRGSARGLWARAFALAALVYLPGAHFWGVGHIDTIAPSWGGWALAHGYGNDLSHVPHLPSNPFFLHVDGRLVPGRLAGVVLASVPLQLVLAPLHWGAFTVGVLTGCLMTSVAVANLAVLVRKLASSERQALAWAGVLAFATPLWSISSAELWTHSATALWLSCLLLAVVRERWLLAALAGVAAVWTRPHLAVVVAVVVSWSAWQMRRWRPVLVVAPVSAAGVAGLVAWNNWMFGAPTLAGSYGGQAENVRSAGNILTDPSALWHYLDAALITFFSPYRGLFLMTPVALVGVYAVARTWRQLPGWTHASLAAGLAYQAVQLRGNGWSGGDAFYGNRLAIELMVLAAPACFAGYGLLAPRSRRLRVWARVLTAVSIAVFATGVLLAGAAMVLFLPHNPWLHHQLVDTVRSAPGATGLTALGLAVVVAVLATWREPSRRVATLLASVRPATPT